MFMDNSNEKAPEYFTAPGKLENYKWYKPLLTGLLTFVFYVVFSIAVAIIACVIVGLQGEDPMAFIYSYTGGYDTLDAYSAVGAFMTMGSVAVMIPSLWLALLITKERPFKTVTTTRSRWNMNFFVKGLLLGFIVFLIMLPLQCIAEEYMFRGFMGQTISSWVKNPVVGILLSTLVFTLCHPYNIIGKLYVAVMGLSMAIAVWYIKGIEAAAAFHIVNNFFSFVLSGIGAAQIRTDVSPEDLIYGLIINVVFVVLLIFVDKKFKWFAE